MASKPNTVRLTEISEAQSLSYNIYKDEDHNVWVYLDFNGKDVLLPLAVWGLIDEHIFKFLGEDTEGDLN